MAMTKVMNLGVEVRVNSKGAVSGIRQVGTAVEQTGKKAAKSSKGVATLTKAMGALGVTVGAAGLARGLGASLNAFSGFEQQLRNVQNITEISGAELGQFKTRLESLPSSLGSSIDLTKGLYQALSSGIPKDNAIDFMTQNAKAAKGNLADLSQTISASTSILAAFQLPASEVGTVLDSMTKTVDLGKLTFTDLANNIGKSASIAASAGVSYNELFAATAQLTLGGLSVEESMTGIRAIMTATISPTKDQAEAMEKYGVTLSASALKAQGFTGYMESIAAAVGNNVEAMAELFPNVRAIGPALALARKNGGEFGDILDKVSDSSGKVGRNFENMSQSVKAQQEEMKVNFQKMLQQIGEELAPSFLKIARVAAEVFPVVADFVAGVVQDLATLADSISWVTDKLALVWNSDLEGQWNGFGVIIKALTAFLVIMAAKAGLAALALGPIGIAAVAATAAITGINAAIGLYEDHVDRLVKKTNDLTDSNEMLNAGLKANGMTYPQLAEDMGIVYTAQDDLVAMVREELKARVEAGEATELQAAILKGAAVDAAEQEAKIVKAIEAETAAREQGAKIMDDVRAQLAKLRGDFKAFDTEQEKQAKKRKKQTDDWKTGIEDIDKALEDMMAIAGETAEQFAELGEDAVDGMSDLERAIDQGMRDVGIALHDGMMEPFDEAIDEMMDKIIDDMPNLIPPSIMEGPKQSIFNGITGGLSDALGKGFEGEWDSFMDLWDSLWQDAAKSMTGFIMDGLGMALNGKDAEGNPFGFGDLFGGKDTEGSIASQAGVGSTIGGLGQVLQAREQGGVQGAMQGAMGGMQAGAILGPIGMAVGAIAGGLIGFFGGKEDPASSVAVGPRNSVFSSTEADREQEQVYEGKIRSLYDKFEAAYRGIFLSLGDASLGTVLRQQGRVPNVDSGGRMDMTPDELMEWLGREALPDAFEEYYRPVLEQGLGNLGVNNNTLDALFDKLPDMTGDARIQFLADFVQTVVDINKSLEMADWETFNDMRTQDSMTGFLDSVTETTDQMDLMMDSWRAMGLDDIVREVDAIGDAFDTALAGVAQMLDAIDKTRQGIQDGWAGFREDLKVGQMTDAEKQNYYAGQIDGLMADLENATTPEGIQRANDALMDAMRNLANVVDPSAAMGMGFEGTWGDYLDELAEQASATATAGLDAVEEQVKAAYDELVERLEQAAAALLEFEKAASGTGDTESGGYWDENGNFVPGEKNPDLDNTADKSMTVDLTTPITLNLTTYLDGRELKNEMRAEVNAELGEMYSHLLSVIEGRAAID